VEKAYKPFFCALVGPFSRKAGAHRALQGQLRGSNAAYLVFDLGGFEPKRIPLPLEGLTQIREEG
jgi:hypothetical protein